MKLFKLLARCLLLLVAGLSALTIFFPQWLDFKDDLITDYQKKKHLAQPSYSKQGPPSDWKLHIRGSISPNSRYRVSVLYSATNSDEACQQYLLFSGGHEPKGKWFSYYAEIEQGQHSLVVPLNTYKPKSHCEYRPKLISLGVTRTKEEPSNGDDIFYALKPDQASLVHREERAPLIDNVNLNLQCTATVRDGVAVDEWTCGEVGELNKKLKARSIRYRNINLQLDIDLVDEAISTKEIILRTQRYQTRNTLFEVMQLIKLFREVMKREPTEDERNQLLHRSFDITKLGAKDDSDYVKRFVRAHERSFVGTQTQGEVLEDIWGNPFQFVSPASYSEQEYEIISLGPDGLLSNDDIWVNSQFKSNVENTSRNRR